MKQIVIEEPNEKQKLFLKATQKHVCFGGSRGGGKSWSIDAKCYIMACAYAGIRQLIVRRSYPELVNNHVNVMRAKTYGICKYNDKDKVLKFPNGSTVNFMYCSRDSDLDRLQGQQYDIIYLDEATLLSEYQMKSIAACLRGVNDFPKRMYYTCNPNGQGMGYIKRLFIDRNFDDNEDPDDYIFIQSLVTDNKALMEKQPDYIKQLESLPPRIRDAWLYGDWSVYQGQFFDFRNRPEHYLDRKDTHVIEPFEIPPDWTVIRALDWGYSRPFAVLYIFLSPDNVFYVGLEVYGCTKTPNEGVKWTPDQLFQELRRIENEHRWLKGKKIQGVADPAIWDAQTGESIAERAAKYGIYFQKGDHERLAGWLQIHYRLNMDENNYPMLYFFKNCKGCIRTLPILMYSETRPEDLDTTQEDHIADALRYACMMRAIKPRIKADPDEYHKTPQSVFLDIAKEDIIARPRAERMQIIRGAHGETETEN